jgi:putative transposase
MCRVLEVSHSGYYAWNGRPPSARSQTRTANEIAIKAAHVQTRETYGNRRLHRELKEQGHTMSQWQVQRLGATLQTSKEIQNYHQ